MRPRPSHPPEFKARVALEALEGSDSLEALAERHGVPVESVMRWREVVRSQTPRLFQSPLLRLGLWLWPASVGRRFVVAITLGIAIGRLLPNAVPALEPIGLLGLKASQLMVMPLLICELLLALGSLPKGSMANLLRLGGGQPRNDLDHRRGGGAADAADAAANPGITLLSPFPSPCSPLD